MKMPGFTADASIYRSAVTYAAGRTPVMLENAITLSYHPVLPPRFCYLEYLLCQGFIPRCVDRCISNNLWQCALARDPQACEAAVAMRCSGTCTVACDAQYDRCLRG
ncbi:MAG: hypothetical protein OIN88_08980 [Candidatus Methanoperedens sp.]|nr:hypothetical protein [Candidatus Methanoperedens sp.]